MGLGRNKPQRTGWLRKRTGSGNAPKTRNIRKTIAIAATLITAFSIAACGSNANSSNKEQITLTVDIFGSEGFGYDNLYTSYMSSHPNIKIVERGKGQTNGAYLTQLNKWLADGVGAGDVVAFEESALIEMKAQPDKFVNLYDYGAADLESNFLLWKWNQGVTADNRQLVGLGTDVGSMGICYRRDLFAQAGLPSDRESVSALWPSWEEYINTGKKFMKAKLPNIKFVDSANNFFNIAATQLAGKNTGYLYFDNDNKLVIESNPDLKTAWNLTTQITQAGLSADLTSFTTDWENSFKEGRIATAACPAWMTGIIKGLAGDSQAGKWDIALPPGGGGNWGGSFLGVPKQTRYPKEAAELAMYLTGIEGQLGAFEKSGNLPSNPRALQDPMVENYKNAYFNNAPTGKIYTESATALRPIYLGPKTQVIRDIMDASLRNVSNGSRTADQAWNDAVTLAKNAVK